MASELTMRTCGRAGCRWPAAASLSFRYDTRQVWLLDLAPQPHPALYDLCPDHADGLTVPRGWDRVDQREPQEAVREPAGRDLETAIAPALAEAHAGAATNRYAALADELPRLARQYGAPSAGAEDAGPRPSREGAAGLPATGPPREAPAQTVVPARDLAPLPVQERETVGRPAATGADPAAAPPGPAPPPTDAEEAPGQLAIPVDDVDDAAPGEAVVVSIEAAGARRRPDSGRR